MFEVVVGTVLTIVGTGLLAMLGWAFHMSNKVAVLESESKGFTATSEVVEEVRSRVAVLEADKTSLRDYLDARFAEVTRRLDKIDRRLEHSEE